MLIQYRENVITKDLQISNVRIDVVRVYCKTRFSYRFKREGAVVNWYGSGLRCKVSISKIPSELTRALYNVIFLELGLGMAKPTL